MAVARESLQDALADELADLLFRSQFILEGIPAVLVGVLVWFALPDYPE